jgi:hypothetical protein
MTTKERILYLLDAFQNLQVVHYPDLSVPNPCTEIIVELERIRDLVVRETRIGVVGEVSTGKSTTLNSILGNGFLPTGIGSTTGVPTEIRHRQGKYCAKIHFSTQEHMRPKFQTISDTWDSDGGGCGAERQLLGPIFTLTTDDIVAKPCFNLTPAGVVAADYDLCAYIGRECEKIEADSMDEFLPLLRARLPSYTYAESLVFEAADIYNPYAHQNVIQLLVIEGPFEHIPPNIVIVDTPGLGDADLSRSARTMEQLEGFDEVWMTVEAKRAFTDGDAAAAVRDIFNRQGQLYLRDSFRVIATGRVEDQEHVALIHKTVLDACIPSDAVMNGIVRKPFLTNIVSNISIQFSNNSDGNDVDTLRAPLVARMGDIANARLMAINAGMSRVTDLINSIPGVQLEFPSDWAHGVIYELKPLRRSTQQLIRDNFNSFFKTVSKQGKWGALHVNTVKAIMSPWEQKGGRWRGLGSLNCTGKVRTGYIDINLDIGLIWGQWCGSLANAVNSVFDASFQTLSNGLNGHCNAFVSNRRMAMMRLLSRARVAISGYGVKNAIRDAFGAAGIFNRRNYLPTKDEVMAIVENTLFLILKDFFRTLNERIRAVSIAFTPQVVAPEIRTAMQEILNNRGPYDNNGVDLSDPFDGLRDPITDEIFDLPVMAMCGHTYETSTIPLLRGICPLCRTRRNATDQLIPRNDLVQRIIEVRAQQHVASDMEINGEPWYLVMWRGIRGAAAAGDLEVDMENLNL